jgi:hypothetical protein
MLATDSNTGKICGDDELLRRQHCGLSRLKEGERGAEVSARYVNAAVPTDYFAENKYSLNGFMFE